MHGDNFLKGPGDDELRKLSSHGKKPDPKPDSADKSIVPGKNGGVGKAAGAQKKKAEEDAFWEGEEKRRQEQANTHLPETPVNRTVVKITHIQWDRDKVILGGKAFVSMEIVLPPQHVSATGVTLRVEQRMPDGGWKATESKPARCDAQDGKAHCELAVPQPLQNPDGTTPSKIQFRVLAKHAYSEETPGPPVEAVPGSPTSALDCVIFYSPARREYLVLETEEEYQSLLMELEKLEGLKGKTRKALEAADPAVRRRMQADIEKEAAALFEGEVIGEAEVLEELLLIRRNPRWGKTPGWVYIRPHAKKNGTPIKGRWRSDRDATVKKNLEDLLKKAQGSKEHSPLFEAEFKLKLFKVAPLEGQWPLQWNTRVDKEGKVGNQPFTFGKEAAVCRYSLGWDGAEASASWKEKKIRIGTSGHLSYGLLEGRAEGRFPLPEQGVNLLEFLKRTTPAALVLARDRECLLRLHLTLSAKAFAGLTVSAALNPLNLDLSREKPGGKKKSGPEASSGASGNGFAGAQGSAGLEVATEWSRKAGGAFEALGGCGVEAGGSAGLGAGTEWKIEYRSGTFHFKGGAALTVGLGLKGGFSFELGVEEGWRFVGHLLHCMDFHYVVEIQEEAFNAYKNYTFTLMTLGHQALTAQRALVVEVITDFGTWLGKLGNKLESVKKALSESSIASATLTNVPPEALGQALITIMQSREPGDFRSILVILNSTVRRNANPKADPSANHKLKWTLRSVSGISIPDVDGPVTEAKKEDALRNGIKIIDEFGRAQGRWANINDQEPNDIFVLKFHKLLSDNGIKP